MHISVKRECVRTAISSPASQLRAGFTPETASQLAPSAELVAAAWPSEVPIKAKRRSRLCCSGGATVLFGGAMTVISPVNHRAWSLG